MALHKAPPLSQKPPREELWLRAPPQHSTDLLLESWSLSGPVHPHSVLAASQSPRKASLHPPHGLGTRETVVCCGKRNSICKEPQCCQHCTPWWIWWQ